MTLDFAVVTLDFAVVTLNFKILQFLHVIKILFLAISQKVKVVGRNRSSIN